MKKLKYRISKLKNRILKNYYSIEAKAKYPTLLMAYRLSFFVEILFIGGLVFAFLNLIEVYNFPILKNFIHLIDFKNEQMARQIIFSQVSLSFLILSLLSFLTNLKKDKILGTSIYRIVFAYSLFGNLALLSLIIFSLLFINIMIYFYDTTSLIIPYIFLVVMTLLSVYILKIITYTNNHKKSINKISTLYYTKNAQIVKHNFIRHGKNYETPQIIFDLVEDTDRKIRNNDIDYIINFKIYAKLSNLTLINFRKKVQENHTERYTSKEDILTFWIRQISVLLDSNLLISAIEQYNQLLYTLIRNKVYLNNYELTQLLEKILRQLYNSPNIDMFSNLKTQVFSSMRLTIRYSDFRLNNDFSYTRLGQYDNGNLLYIHSMNGNFYKDYYKIICNNPNILDNDKKRMTYNLIEDIRMSAIEIDSPFQLDYHNLNSQYYKILDNERNNLDGDLELVGVPLSILFYEIILLQDSTAIYHLIYQYNMNSIYYACLMVISKLVTQYIYSSNENKYLVEIIKLLSMKLEHFDSYKLKLNKAKIIRSEMNNKVYSTLFFRESDKKSLELIYQSLQMKKHEVNYTKVKDNDLKKICELIFDDENRETLNKKWQKNRKYISSLYFPLV